jgi:hypothetical protein
MEPSKMPVRRVGRAMPADPEAAYFQRTLERADGRERGTDPLMKRKMKINRHLKKMKAAGSEGPVEVIG